MDQTIIVRVIRDDAPPRESTMTSTHTRELQLKRNGGGGAADSSSSAQKGAKEKDSNGTTTTVSASASASTTSAVVVKKDLPKDCFNRKQLVATHEKAKKVTDDLVKGKQPLEKLLYESKSSDGESMQASASALKELSLPSLKDIFLPQLEVDKRHFGRVLYGMLCVAPFRLSTVISVLADKSGKAVRVSIFNIPPTLTGKEMETRFGAGQKVAIKEPYFKLSTDEMATVCVYNPANLVHVDDFNNEIAVEYENVTEELDKLDKIRAEGNQQFAQLNWKGAIEQYTSCIDRCNAILENEGRDSDDKEKVKHSLLLAYSNRAEVWLQLQDFRNALDDANRALEFDPDHLKSVSRRDRAWQGLGKQQTIKVRVPVAELFPEAAASKAADERENVLKGKSWVSAPPSTAAAKVVQPPEENAKDAKDAKGAKDVPSEPKLMGNNVSKHALVLSGPPEADLPESVKNVPSISSKAKGGGGGESKNSSSLAASDALSKIKGSERKSVSPSPGSRSGKNIQTKDNSSSNPSAAPTKGPKAPDSKASDPPNSPIAKPVSNSKRKLGPALGRQISIGSETKGDTFPTGNSKAKLNDSDDDESNYSSFPQEGKGSDPRNNYSPPKPKPKAVVAADARSASPPVDVESDQRVIATSEPQGESFAPIECEGPLFATWLDSIRSSGDLLLNEGKWGEAIRKYDKVTKYSPPKRNRDKAVQALLLAFSHRSEAWIWLGSYENSLQDADIALELMAKFPKSVVGFEAEHLLSELRRGRALHGMGQYEKACAIFAAALAASPDEKSISDHLEKSRICFEQSRDGIYDLNEYFSDGCRGPPPPCSDFVGPVEIRHARGKGRGLFVTRNVYAGDLLFVSNPLAVVRRRLGRKGGADEEEDYSFLTTKWRRKSSTVGLDEFVGRLALLKSKRKMYQLYTLTAGHPDEDSELPDVSVFIPGSQFELPEGWKNVSTDLDRLRSIVILNAIDGGLNPLHGALNDEDDEDDPIECVGLWALPSFMNHSCVPNCHMIDVGNAMFVRASRNILEGEELTRAYFDVYQNGLDRNLLCTEWEFACSCERCSLEKELTVRKVLPLHDYRKLLENAREESLRRLNPQVEKDRSLSFLLPEPQPALLQLRKFADSFDDLLSDPDALGLLGSKEKAWIGASYLEAYVSRFVGTIDRGPFMLAIENILEFMTNTAFLGIGHAENALARASLLLETVEDVYGEESRTYQRIETRVLDLFETAYGSLRKEVLLNMSKMMVSTRMVDPV